MAYSKYAMNKSSVYKWHRRFNDGIEYMNDNAWRGQPRRQKNVYTCEQNAKLGALSSKWLTALILNMIRETVRQISSWVKKSITKMHQPSFSPFSHYQGWVLFYF